MCGIFGIVDLGLQTVSSESVLAATRLIDHRGPDHIDVFTDRYVGLGHTRLSIVDLSWSANQPLTTQDDRYTIVYNGEIYNYVSLRSSLEQVGVEFRTTSDTEVLLQAVRTWGVRCVEKLNGIFAFACWDREQQELILARDRFGVKPLYFLHNDSQLVVASEIKSILASVPKWSRTINCEALHEYLYYGVSLGGKTLLNGIQQLAPAHYAVWKQETQKLETCRYWQPSTTSYTGNVNAAVRETRERLETGIKRQLMGDVPIGVFLSGGLDSSAITAFASKHYSGKIKTYSVAFDFGKNNELPLARQVADHFQTDHHEIEISGTGLEQTILDLVHCHDVPFGDAANIPLYLLCRELSGDPKVVLQGDGGDEVFGGYRRYASLFKEKRFQMLAKALQVPGVSSLVPYRYRRYLECFLPKDRGERFAKLLTTETSSSPPTKAFHQDVQHELDKLDPFAHYKKIASQYKDLDSVQAMLLTDLQIVLPDVFLEKVDRSTMAHGIEVRVPLLENDLVAFLVSLPSTFKVRNGQQKWLLREAMKDILPSDILRAKKSGFGVPYSQWLRGPLQGLARDSLLSLSDAGVADPIAVEKMMDAHASGSEECSFLLWKLFQLSLWFREYKVSF